MKSVSGYVFYFCLIVSFLLFLCILHVTPTFIPGQDNLLESKRVSETHNQIHKRIPKRLNRKLDLINSGQLSLKGTGEIPVLNDVILHGKQVDCEHKAAFIDCVQFHIEDQKTSRPLMKAIFSTRVNSNYSGKLFSLHLIDNLMGNGNVESLGPRLAGPMQVNSDNEVELILTEHVANLITAKEVIPINLLLALVCQNCYSNTYPSPIIADDVIPIMDLEYDDLRLTPTHLSKRTTFSGQCPSGPVDLVNCCIHTENVFIRDMPLFETGATILNPSTFDLTLCNGQCRRTDEYIGDTIIDFIRNDYNRTRLQTVTRRCCRPKTFKPQNFAIFLNKQHIIRGVNNAKVTECQCV